MADRNGFDSGSEIARQMDGGAGVTQAFSAELAQLQREMWMTSREMDSFSSGIGGGLRRAFDGLILDGMKLSDALKGVARSMADTAYSIAMKPIQDAVSQALSAGMGNMLSGAAFADGGAFTQGRVTPFAKGGVVAQPTHFPMRGGIGLMGEAGPEAIMPLRRGADGRLGVSADGGAGRRPMQVTINVSTPDVAGFARSQSQIAAQMGRALARGQRNL